MGPPKDQIIRRLRVLTPNGNKASRFADLAVVDIDGKTPLRLYQIGVLNANGTPVAREVRAINDLFNTTGVSTSF
jgi:hypothetical protein